MGGAPWTLAEVLTAEYLRLFGPVGLPAPPDLYLREEDVLDARVLTRQLARLGGQKRALGAQPGSTPPTGASQRRELADAVNELLRDGWLFDTTQLSIPQSRTYRRLAREATTDEQRHRLNRQMFDAAVPGAVRSLSDIHLRAVLAALHARRPSGLALSGGGIRSATFALGVLQGLAEKGLLERFHYLSTVSGGGYIGSWLSSWVRRHEFGIRGVCSQLSARAPRPLEPEPAPIRHLRAYSNYLTPRLGLLSGDTWALVGTYVRNLLLNWLILLPCLAVLVLLPRLLAAGMAHPGMNAAATAPLPNALAAAATIFGGLGLGMVVWGRPIQGPGTAGFFRDASFLWRCLAPFIIAAVLLALRWSWIGGASLELGSFIAIDVGVTVVAFVLFGFRLAQPGVARRGAEDQVRALRQLVWEFSAALASGAAGGARTRR